MLNKIVLRELMNDMYIKSLRELSKRSHIPYSTLNRMIQGYDMHVSSVIELSRFFKVPLDVLINKSYKFIGVTQDREILYDTSNLMEVTLKMMLETNNLIPVCI